MIVITCPQFYNRGSTFRGLGGFEKSPPAP